MDTRPESYESPQGRARRAAGLPDLIDTRHGSLESPPGHCSGTGGHGRRPGLAAGTVAAFHGGAAGYLLAMMSSPLALGVGLFMGVPFVSGLLAGYFAALFGAGVGTAQLAMLGATGLLILLFLVLGWEGAACIIMALPITLIVALIAAALGWFIRRAPEPWRRGGMGLALLVAPALGARDAWSPPEPAPLAVESEIVIDAPIDVVWRNVVSFPPIDAPLGPIFAIVAAPLEARIDGDGPGATRRCIFTNGEFVEPIHVFDEPRELTFGVAAQPPGIADYLDGTQGQFLLAANGDGTTTIRGTTWYRLKIGPVWYWRLWSQGLLHAIHMRVLEHIKRISERPESEGPPPPIPGWIAAANATCRCTRHAPAPGSRP